MKKHFVTSILMAVVTTVLLGVIYPMLVTGIAQLIFPRQANGSLITANGKLLGSHLIGQPFSSPGYFRSRPSAAGTGYDASNSGGSNLGPTNKMLVDRMTGDLQKAHAENPAALVPMDLVTTSGSGLDPHISPEAAEFQVPRIAQERKMAEADVRAAIVSHTEGRQLGFLGEPRVNVLELNLDLDMTHPISKPQ
jgi:K+-transporting ATPase ATPase C chain